MLNLDRLIPVSTVQLRTTPRPCEQWGHGIISHSSAFPVFLSLGTLTGLVGDRSPSSDTLLEVREIVNIDTCRVDLRDIALTL
jgi:hypothetical protein